MKRPAEPIPHLFVGDLDLAEKRQDLRVEVCFRQAHARMTFRIVLCTSVVGILALAVFRLLDLQLAGEPGVIKLLDREQFRPFAILTLPYIASDLTSVAPKIIGYLDQLPNEVICAIYQLGPNAKTTETPLLNRIIRNEAMRPDDCLNALDKIGELEQKTLNTLAGLRDISTRPEHSRERIAAFLRRYAQKYKKKGE